MIELDAEAVYRSLAARLREEVVGRDIRLVGVHTGGGFAGGLAHPFLGLDHLLAMLTVGAEVLKVRQLALGGFEQARVIDGNRGLIGEHTHQIDLILTK